MPGFSPCSSYQADALAEYHLYGILEEHPDDSDGNARYQDFADIPEAVVAIVVGPAIAFIGFVAMALAIIIKPTCKNKANI